MISEPELVGGDGDGPIPGTPHDPPPVEPGPGAERPARRRPWWWALGGAVVASALWAGGLYAYQAMGPDLGGYRTSEDLCDAAKLKALGTAYGERGESEHDPDQQDRHEALDQSRCSVTFGTAEPTFAVDVVYRLHKKTDPGPEFEPVTTADTWEDWEHRPLTGVGERAFFAQDDAGYAVLTVLDGQAVLSLTVSMQMEYGPEENLESPPDDSAMDGVKDHMVEDMKALMAELKR
ncbi:hypothetical protein ACGF5F_02575 [Streptomyces sp. NPDC047821]|uniref:hypothetical protein n=1 Tax=Streptomyces sp. NPDC047821 TaxID=3365488 RepID=UPI003718BAD6